MGDQRKGKGMNVKMRRTKAPLIQATSLIPACLLDASFLSLDISSTAAGWALFIAGRLKGFGVCRPSSRSPSSERIDEIREVVVMLTLNHLPDFAVMEWSNGKVHGGAKTGKSGLAVLGQAQGVVRERLVGLGYDPILIGEEWTGGKTKQYRAYLTGMTHLEYREAVGSGELKDNGFDAADAIGLGDYVVGMAKVARLQEERKSRS